MKCARSGLALPVAKVWLLCWLGVVLSGCAAKTGYHDPKPPPGGMNPEMEEMERTLEEMPQNVQKRVLRFLNEAHRPEDLQRFPQRMRLEFEHGMPEGAYQHQKLPIDPRLLEGETREEHGFQIPVMPIEGAFAQQILRDRPLLGYRDLREVLALDLRRWRELLGDWLVLFGPRVYGRWEELPGTTERPIMHAALLHTGKVVMLPSSTDTVIWDPAAGITVLPGSTTGLTADLFCSGHSFLADGTLLAVGGGGGSPGAASSIQGWKFDPAAESWSRTSSDMHFMRWYPTTVTLDDAGGRVLVASGWTVGTNPAPQMEIYDPATDSFSLVTAQGPVGEKLFGQTYPGLHLMSGNRIFYAPVGFGNCTQTADPWPGTEPSGIFEFSGALTGEWTNTGDNVRTKGMSVPILRRSTPQMRVTTFGGGTLSDSGTARTIDLAVASPAWDFAFPMLEQRVHPNVVLLPDGTVFVSGGMEATSPTPPNGGASELYDPDSGASFEMDALHHPRHYHSIAVLLPSGQVMTTGGASPGGCSLSVENTIEIFSPPYLFRGSRPVISSIPGSVSQGAEFRIGSPDAADITRIVMVRPMAVTHQTDSEQRVIPLTFQRYGGSELRAEAPDGSSLEEIAPKGYYLVFLLNSRGVPSEGKFVQLM